MAVAVNWSLGDSEEEAGVGVKWDVAAERGIHSERDSLNAITMPNTNMQMAKTRPTVRSVS